MEPTINVQFTMQALRTTLKSLSIGCDQLAKKIDSVTSSNTSKWYRDTAEELMMLMETRQRLEQALSDFLKEMNHLV